MPYTFHSFQAASYHGSRGSMTTVGPRPQTSMSGSKTGLGSARHRWQCLRQVPSTRCWQPSFNPGVPGSWIRHPNQRHSNLDLHAVRSRLRCLHRNLCMFGHALDLHSHPPVLLLHRPGSVHCPRRNTGGCFTVACMKSMTK